MTFWAKLRLAEVATMLFLGLAIAGVVYCGAAIVPGLTR